jgi:hypothetical protein
MAPASEVLRPRVFETIIAFLVVSCTWKIRTTTMGVCFQALKKPLLPRLIAGSTRGAHG